MLTEKNGNIKTTIIPQNKKQYYICSFITKIISMATTPNKAELEKKIIDQFLGLNDELAIAFLLELRNSGGLYLVNPLLEVLISNRGETLKRTIVDLLTDVKEKEAVDLYINFLKAKFPAEHITEVVTICWQSRLNFSQHIDIFFEILIRGDYQTAFEAFTVIENNIDDLSSEQLSHYIGIVKKNVAKANRDKQLLLLEMVSTLDKAKRTAI